MSSNAFPQEKPPSTRLNHSKRSLLPGGHSPSAGSHKTERPAGLDNARLRLSGIFCTHQERHRTLKAKRPGRQIQNIEVMNGRLLTIDVFNGWSWCSVQAVKIGPSWVGFRNSLPSKALAPEYDGIPDRLSVDWRHKPFHIRHLQCSSGFAGQPG